MKHVIVTGGAGFIGSHLCEFLLSRGFAVTAIDNLATGAKENIDAWSSNPNFNFIQNDVCGLREISELRLVRQFGLEGVLHFACPASPVDFDKIPLEILKVNSVGTLQTIDWALKFNARYVFASSSEIYGDPDVHPQTESYRGNVNTTGPRACYDEAKRFSEACVSSAVRAKGLRGRIMRIFNTYGPRMRADDGRVVPDFCMRALQGQDLIIHGDGLQTRSFCFVSDLIEGAWRLFESDLNEPVNIGNPIERTIVDFAQTVIRLSGGKSQIRHTQSRPDDPRKRCPDIKLATAKLGWKPKITLEQGLKECLKFYRKFVK